MLGGWINAKTVLRPGTVGRASAATLRAAAWLRHSQSMRGADKEGSARPKPASRGRVGPYPFRARGIPAIILLYFSPLQGERLDRPKMRIRAYDAKTDRLPAALALLSLA